LKKEVAYAMTKFLSNLYKDIERLKKDADSDYQRGYLAALLDLRKEIEYAIEPERTVSTGRGTEVATSNPNF
jgi:hypothetical protein